MTMNSFMRTIAERLAAAAGLLVLSPLLGAAALSIILEDGFPVFFRQVRVGQGGKPFTILKFRSMRNAPGALITSAADSRITRTGRVLRKYKIDELPQLFNVLKGDIRFVGPRPEVSAYVDFHDPAWQPVLAMKPGITDLATLVYRNEEDLLATAVDPDKLYREAILPAKLRLNGEYNRLRSLRTDVKLVRLTIWYSLRPNALDPVKIHREFSAG